MFFFSCLGLNPYKTDPTPHPILKIRGMQSPLTTLVAACDPAGGQVEGFERHLRFKPETLPRSPLPPGVPAGFYHLLCCWSPGPYPPNLYQGLSSTDTRVGRWGPEGIHGVSSCLGGVSGLPQHLLFMGPVRAEFLLKEVGLHQSGQERGQASGGGAPLPSRRWSDPREQLTWWETDKRLVGGGQCPGRPQGGVGGFPTGVSAAEASTPANNIGVPAPSSKGFHDPPPA